ncbi:hypothetical protein CO151_01625 [bacterium CG_4_9_14_3_um_filter_65_15]|nr:MAG: hypothetical protein CO151_01625 [bacterium CG_4_9_14_3_um_filter_65_15]
MMLAAVTALRILLPILYAATLGLYLWLFYSDHPTARHRSTQLAAVTVITHMATMVAQTAYLQRIPLESPLEFLSALGLAIMVTYLVIELRIRAKNTGFIVVGMAFFLVTIAEIFFRNRISGNPLLQLPGFAAHAALAILAYTALSLSFLYAILYLILARQLANHSFGLLFRRLPSLEVLERMSIGAIKLALPLLFSALALGHLWMYHLRDTHPELAAQLTPWDPKILTTWVIFLGYLTGMAGYHFLGWRGRRMNMLAVGAFIVVMGATGAAHHFFPTFHKFTTASATVDPRHPGANP